MSRCLRVAAVAFALLAALAPAAAANPDFRSVIEQVSPPQPDLKLQVLGFDQNFQLINRTGKVVVIRGYENEPYARLLPDGTVQENRNSPATYLNADRYGTSQVPSTAGPDKPVVWRTVDETGRFTWHDHRMHWMSTSTPPAVKDTAKKTKIFDYVVPMDVGGQPTKVRGTLFWVGPPGGGMPIGAIAALVVIALGSVALVVIVRRRRATGADRPAGPPDGQADAADRAEAW